MRIRNNLRMKKMRELLWGKGFAIDHDTYQSFTLPNMLLGTVYIRVKDLDQTAGHRAKDTIYSEYMFI
jgi:hypothetical protein